MNNDEDLQTRSGWVWSGHETKVTCDALRTRAFGACAPRGESGARAHMHVKGGCIKTPLFGSSGHSDRFFTVPGAPSCVFLNSLFGDGPISVMKFYILTGAALALTFTLTSANADFNSKLLLFTS